MKIVRLLSLASLALVFSLASAFAQGTSPVQVGAPVPDEDDGVCVSVSCDGQHAGTVCGRTTQDLVDAAIALCSTVE